MYPPERTAFDSESVMLRMVAEITGCQNVSMWSAHGFEGKEIFTVILNNRLAAQNPKKKVGFLGTL